MAYTVTLIPGDGIGPEVTLAARRVLEATGIEFNWDIQYAGAEALEKFGTPLPASTLDSIKRNRVALKGPVTTPIGEGFTSINVALRRELDLFACLRLCKIYPGVPSRYESVDLIIIRENTEDLYAGIEFEKGTVEVRRLIELIAELKQQRISPDTGISLKFISERASKRIVSFAFDYARVNKRRKVTAVHKANIMKFSDGLFLSAAKEVAKDYPEIEFEDMIVDNLCMQLVRNPERFDILVLPNLYGDIVSDLCAGLIGGLGMAPGANVGDGLAVFEPSHGSAPKYAGQNKANPMAMMFSGVMMLRYLGEKEAAAQLETALAQVISEGKTVTYDLKAGRGEAATTSEVADAVIQKLGEIKAC